MQLDATRTAVDLSTRTCRIGDDIELRWEVDVKNVVWFPAGKVAETLGYSNFRQAIRYHVDDKNKQVGSQLHLRGPRVLPQRELQCMWIDQTGLNTLFDRRHKSEVVDLRHCIFQHILPQIREVLSQESLKEEVVRVRIVHDHDTKEIERLRAVHDHDTREIERLRYVHECDMKEIERLRAQTKYPDVEEFDWSCIDQNVQLQPYDHTFVLVHHFLKRGFYASGKSCTMAVFKKDLKDWCCFDKRITLHESAILLAIEQARGKCRGTGRSMIIEGIERKIKPHWSDKRPGV